MVAAKFAHGIEVRIRRVQDQFRLDDFAEMRDGACRKRAIRARRDDG